MASVNRIGLASLFFAAVLSSHAAGQQRPTFRAGIDLVTVDATVLDADGRPIQGLRADDFALKVDGEARRVVSAQYVPHLAAAAPLEGSVPYHYSSNEYSDAGRLILIAVDQANIRRLEGTAALRAAGRFIEALDPNDRVAVAGLTYLGPIEFSNDHRGARAQLERLVGEGDPAYFQFNMGLTEALAISDGGRMKLNDVVIRECGEALSRLENLRRLDETGELRDPCAIHVEQEARAIAQHARTQAGISIAALRRLIERLKTIDGPKTLVLLSEGLVAEPQLVDFAELGAAAQAARVTIYILRLEVPVIEAAQDRVSPTAMDDLQLRADGLARLAGAARGALFHLVGSDPYPFRRIAIELSGYYLLAFEPRLTDRDGRLHRIQVSLNRGGATLRARPAFRLEPGLLGVAATEQQLGDLLRAPRLATELPLRVGTYTYSEPDLPKLRVVVSAEADTAQGLTAETVIGFILVGDRRVIAASGMHRAESGRSAFSALVSPGDYTLKVAAIDSLGRHGSVERPFAARLAQSGGIGVSDLILALVPDRADAQLQPIVDRTADSRLLAYLELYTDQNPSAGHTVRLEIAQSEAAGALVTVPAVVARRGARWSIARAVLPLEALAPGRYIARAEISLAGRPIRSVTRAFSIVEGSRVLRF